jgi:hypothetical protein
VQLVINEIENIGLSRIIEEREGDEGIEIVEETL